jgi:hypothetical protein
MIFGGAGFDEGGDSGGVSGDYEFHFQDGAMVS